MFGSTILDVAVGLSLVYLSFSLFCSGVREAIARMLSAREEGVVRGLYGLLGAPQAHTEGKKQLEASTIGQGTPNGQPNAPSDATKLVGQILDHGLVKGFVAPGNKIPPYIPAHTVALALLDTLGPQQGTPRTVEEVRDAVTKLPTALQQTLLPLVNAAGNDIVKLRDSIERRVDDVMDRVSGWYRRQTQLVIFVTALLVSFGANVDTIAIAKTLWQDPTVRAAIVAQAGESTGSTLVPADGAVPAGVYTKTRNALQGIELPLGWDHVPLRAEDWSFTSLIGRLLTAFALLLGAPFWFDVLSRFGNLRTVGPKPPRSASPAT
jgi:hypothetical protein